MFGVLGSGLKDIASTVIQTGYLLGTKSWWALRYQPTSTPTATFVAE